MRLAVQDFDGIGLPLVVLHGLYGSARNWGRVGRRLAGNRRVVLLDLRNHGESDHRAGMSFTALAEDVLETTTKLGFERFVLMGHSLGGKVAMRVACDSRGSVEHLIVLDIAPRSYSMNPSLIDALVGLDLRRFSSRSAMSAELAAAIPDEATRLFLLTNLRAAASGFEWRIPLAIIREALPGLATNPVVGEDRYSGRTDFVFGGESAYYDPLDEPSIRRYFPCAHTHVLEGCGHNVHIEGGERFFELIQHLEAS